MTLSEILSISATGFIVVLIVLILLAFIIVLLSKVIRAVEGGATKSKGQKAEKNTQKDVNSPAPVADSAPAVQYSNGVNLYRTDYKTAASIMAIVSHESGIPLERLNFSSIKLDDSLELYKTDDKTAASIMAIVSHQTGIPLERLVFKSIKLIEK